MNRFANALYINVGACNPSGITHSLKEAYDEIRADPHYKGTVALTGDPAVRLMVHQLAFICGVGDGSWSDNYNEAFKACVEKADNVPAGVTFNGELTKTDIIKAVAEERGIPYVDVALEEGTRFERLFDGNDQGG